MLAFINKWWKVFLVVLLLANLGLLVRQEFTNQDNAVLRDEIKKAVEANNKQIDDLKKTLLEDQKRYQESNIKVTEKTLDYENIKAAPLNTNITDKQLKSKLDKFRADYNIKKR